jgi:hypothetical protein
VYHFEIHTHIYIHIYKIFLLKSAAVSGILDMKVNENSVQFCAQVERKELIVYLSKQFKNKQFGMETRNTF